jgi:hypothetical protein
MIMFAVSALSHRLIPSSRLAFGTRFEIKGGDEVKRSVLAQHLENQLRTGLSTTLLFQRRLIGQPNSVQQTQAAVHAAVHTSWGRDRMLVETPTLSAELTAMHTEYEQIASLADTLRKQRDPKTAKLLQSVANHLEDMFAILRRRPAVVHINLDTDHLEMKDSPAYTDILGDLDIKPMRFKIIGPDKDMVATDLARLLEINIGPLIGPTQVESNEEATWVKTTVHPGRHSLVSRLLDVGHRLGSCHVMGGNMALARKIKAAMDKPRRDRQMDPCRWALNSTITLDLTGIPPLLKPDRVPTPNELLIDLRCKMARFFENEAPTEPLKSQYRDEVNNFLPSTRLGHLFQKIARLGTAMSSSPEQPWTPQQYTGYIKHVITEIKRGNPIPDPPVAQRMPNIADADIERMASPVAERLASQLQQHFPSPEDLSGRTLHEVTHAIHETLLRQKSDSPPVTPYARGIL